MIFIATAFTWISQIASWAVIVHLYKAGIDNKTPSHTFIERCAITAFIALTIASITLSAIASQCAMYNIPV